ncbi:hypothetical protein [uncultured Ilyobacter sp.]|uniref:tetratricopeptide repeat protein n=1 Tax=uncultured Ilyobacter sp. TaxID=544433 RepID=UPI0029F4594A|nr:hypothetical protein [uncultured Ilyobacter sp.]
MKKLTIFCFLFPMLILFQGFTFSSERENYHKLKSAENLFEENKFDEAEKIYSQINTQKYQEPLFYNRLVNLYTDKKYSEVLELYDKWEKENLSPEYLFNIGNSYKFTGDNSKKSEDQILNYKNALKAYRKAMMKSSDINIKKNYEITSKLLKKSENSNEKNQNKNQSKDQSGKKDKNKKNQSEKQDKNKEDQKKSQNKTEKFQNDRSSDKSDERKDEGSKEKKNNDIGNKSPLESSEKKDSKNVNKPTEAPKKNGQSEEKSNKKDQKLEELMYYLKNIENLEKESLKNNQKIINQNLNTSDNSKNW